MSRLRGYVAWIQCTQHTRVYWSVDVVVIKWSVTVSLWCRSEHMCCGASMMFSTRTKVLGRLTFLVLCDL